MVIGHYVNLKDEDIFDEYDCKYRPIDVVTLCGLDFDLVIMEGPMPYVYGIDVPIEKFIISSVCEACSLVRMSILSNE